MDNVARQDQGQPDANQLGMVDHVHRLPVHGQLAELAEQRRGSRHAQSQHHICHPGRLVSLSAAVDHRSHRSQGDNRMLAMHLSALHSGQHLSESLPSSSFCCLARLRYQTFVEIAFYCMVCMLYYCVSNRCWSTMDGQVHLPDRDSGLLRDSERRNHRGCGQPLLRHLLRHVPDEPDRGKSDQREHSEAGEELGRLGVERLAYEVGPGRVRPPRLSGVDCFVELDSGGGGGGGTNTRRLAARTLDRLLALLRIRVACGAQHLADRVRPGELQDAVVGQARRAPPDQDGGGHHRSDAAQVSTAARAAHHVARLLVGVHRRRLHQIVRQLLARSQPRRSGHELIRRNRCGRQLRFSARLQAHRPHRLLSHRRVHQPGCHRHHARRRVERRERVRAVHGAGAVGRGGQLLANAGQLDLRCAVRGQPGGGLLQLSPVGVARLRHIVRLLELLVHIDQTPLARRLLVCGHCRLRGHRVHGERTNGQERAAQLRATLRTRQKWRRTSDRLASFCLLFPPCRIVHAHHNFSFFLKLCFYC